MGCSSGGSGVGMYILYQTFEIETECTLVFKIFFNKGYCIV